MQFSAFSWPRDFTRPEIQAAGGGAVAVSQNVSVPTASPVVFPVLPETLPADAPVRSAETHRG